MVAVHAIDELRTGRYVHRRGGRRIEAGRVEVRQFEAGHVEAVLARPAGTPRRAMKSCAKSAPPAPAWVA
jgi:hypothetical protein